MRRLALLLLGLLFAPSAWAVNDWGSGETYTAGCQPGRNVGAGGRICFDMDSSLASADQTQIFSVNGTSALACLKTDYDQAGISATGASPVTAVVRLLPAGVATTTAYGIQACATAGCTLTGLEGTPDAQLACVLLGPGAYSVNFPTLPDSPDIGIFSVEGGK